MRLLLLHKPSRGHVDLRTFVFPRGGGSSVIFNSFQQSAIAHGLVENIDDVKSTFADMCENGTASQCRSYFVILTLHGYETHAIYDNVEYRKFMYMDYIQFQNIPTEEYAQVLMLRDLEILKDFSVRVDHHWKSTDFPNLIRYQQNYSVKFYNGKMKKKWRDKEFC